MVAFLDDVIDFFSEGWRTRLQDASFRGVPFKVNTSDYGVGRKSVHHKYPFDEGPGYVEDLGFDGNDFTIEGYIVQNVENDHDYFDERDNLIAALSAPRPIKFPNAS